VNHPVTSIKHQKIANFSTLQQVELMALLKDIQTEFETVDYIESQAAKSLSDFPQT